MSKIGYLKTTINDDYKKEMRGEISTLEVNISLILLPSEKRTSENAPHYEAFVENPDGKMIQIGSAWEKSKKQIGKPDFEFLSITLDDPSFIRPLNVAGFKDDNGDYVITFRRRQDSKVA